MKKSKLDGEYTTQEDYLDLLSDIANKPLRCMKFNYDMSPSIQNFEHQDALIKINTAGDYLKIVNLKCNMIEEMGERLKMKEPEQIQETKEKH